MELAEQESVPLPEKGVRTLRDVKGEADVIYYLPNREFNYLCLVETFYLDRRIIRVNDLATDLPDTPSPVYAVDMTLRRRPEMMMRAPEMPWLSFLRLPANGEDHVARPLLIYRGTVK